ncbi:MAG: AAA family ATPase [Clostridia bacterium]|nr:AAA family ATPase [Clostridia bacterium]
MVLTGGPCGGKTTAISRIEQELNDCGYKVIIVSETATEIFTNGLRPWEGYIDFVKFQSIMLDFQMVREGLYEQAAGEMNHEKVIIICDRGVMDNKAYISEDEFKHVLESKGLKEISLRERYDAVFHLQTAAEGAESFYTLENNTARKETPEEARKLDHKIIAAWTGHQHLRIIDNSTDFECKINRLVAEFFRFLGEPVPLKIERKFLIRMPQLIEMLKSEKCEMVTIMQTYLISDDHEIEKRIRQRGKNGGYTYFYTTKKSISSLVRIKTEKRISDKEYLSLLMTADVSLHQIVKDRYCFVYNNLYYELDVYPFWKDVAILEIELTEQNQEFEIPPFIEVIRDVTEEPSFKNYAIAKKIPTI